MGKEPGAEGAGRFLVPDGIAFYQCNGPSQQGAVSGQYSLGQFFYGRAVRTCKFDVAHGKRECGLFERRFVFFGALHIIIEAFEDELTVVGQSAPEVFPGAHAHW